MFCTHCGKEINDQAIVCPNCGVATGNYKVTRRGETDAKTHTATKIFLIIACCFSIFSFFIPLAWCIPMTVHYYKAVDRGEKVGVGFKVCTLLFVSQIGGILMLCEKE